MRKIAFLLSVLIPAISLCQVAPLSGAVDTFDSRKWIQPIAITEFRLNLDSIKKVNLELYNYWMRLLGNDTIPICKHIYVAVEPDTVLGDVGSGHDAIARVGFHDGKELVCIKCQHVKYQIINYNWRFGQGRPRLTTEARESHLYLDNPHDSIVTYIRNGPPGGTILLADSTDKRRLFIGSPPTTMSLHACATDCEHKKKRNKKK